MDHLVSTNTVDARTNTAKNCIQTLNELEKLDNELSLNYPTYTNYREFFNKHILYIENGKVIQLIIQNFNSYYKYFKTTKGRLMDIIVTFKVFINKQIRHIVIVCVMIKVFCGGNMEKNFFYTIDRVIYNLTLEVEQ